MNDRMKKVEQAGFTSRLIELRQRLRRETDSAEESLREDVVKTGEISSVPTHPADQDVEGLDVQIAVAQNEESLLEQVESALARIEAGTFGDCQQCGRAIDAQRLRAIPYASRCIACARDYHDVGEQPVPGEPRRFR
jgi:DnaK suppressor protein